MTGVGAWIRYGGPLTPEQIAFAAGHYRAAILQPWETGAARELKRLRPDMTVLAYKCLSSARSYEPGPVFSSGVSFAEAEAGSGGSGGSGSSGNDDAGWFATRLGGTRIEWERYPGHWQLQVWNPDYQRRWVDNVVAEFRDSPFDGVMADNDVFDDYYGLNLPIRGAADMAVFRAALGDLVAAAGTALNGVGKTLVPNIAESRREAGRWESHGAYGGGFEEVWLGYSPVDLFDPVTAEAQLPQAAGPGLSILRVPTDGDDSHPNFRYGLSAFWIFGAGAGAYSATAHDDYSRTQHAPELDWQLGSPLGEPQGSRHTWWREFDGGFAAVNLNGDGRRRRRVRVPAGMLDAAGRPAPSSYVLPPHRGVLFRRAF
ncbi:putative glycoside hydrolase [Arthrobacter sp. APC 3897]|uniref:putative glycoside hydrolase n=1 Tax=Arthrobacter sp. APC 3897 TaxID=3035204 RepID=UPI0025B53FEC|nr:putative glycoside hydrolase [Arthrobacter sp. APC 3897]MDN3483584.1 putative glycoside hydrolase [Arthrobacter sp. APC 3897]